MTKLHKMLMDVSRGTIFSFDYDNLSIYAKGENIVEKDDSIQDCLVTRIGVYDTIEKRWMHTKQNEEHANAYAVVALL